MIRLTKLVELKPLREDGIVGGPGKEDPDTSGLKWNQYPVVPKQHHINAYDVPMVEEVYDDNDQSIEKNAMSAVDTYINGNISDFKVWLQDNATTKTGIIYAIARLSSKSGTKQAIGMILKYLEGK